MLGIMKKRRLNIDTSGISGAVIASLLQRGKLTPGYEPSIRTEREADDMSPVLPLVCLWGEDEKTGELNVCINGSVVGRQLEIYIPREHPQFLALHDHIMNEIMAATQSALKEICRTREGVPVSAIFGRKSKNSLQQAAA